jgi:hypothetical protein
MNGGLGGSRSETLVPICENSRAAVTVIELLLRSVRANRPRPRSDRVQITRIVQLQRLLLLQPPRCDEPGAFSRFLVGFCFVACARQRS